MSQLPTAVFEDFWPTSGLAFFWVAMTGLRPRPCFCTAARAARCSAERSSGLGFHRAAGLAPFHRGRALGELVETERSRKASDERVFFGTLTPV
jgi:hypothetical protein